MIRFSRGLRGAAALLAGGLVAASILSGCALRIDHHHYLHLPSSTTQPAELPSADPELQDWLDSLLDGEGE